MGAVVGEPRCSSPYRFWMPLLDRVLEMTRVRRDELPSAVLMCLYIAGVMCFYYILKPVRSALFLKDLPAGDLPNAYLLSALAAVPVVLLAVGLSRRLSPIALVTATNAGVIGGLLFFTWAVSAQIRYLPYAYFAYVQIVSVLCGAQFWLLAGHIFDGRQARRIYSLLGAAAIVGAIAGSLATDFLKNQSAAFMLVICIVICVAIPLRAHLIWRRRTPAAGGAIAPPRSSFSPRETGGALRTVAGSRHLRLIVLLVFLTMMASQIADWQVDYTAQESFSHLPKQSMEQEIRSFRARFNWATSLIGIGLQLSLTGYVLQRAGIGAALLFLPFGLGLGSMWVFFAPGLASATVALGCNSVFRYSINRAGFELLFLPLSPAMRGEVKLFVDVFVDRAGRAVAAFVILALTTRYMPLGLSGTAAAVVILSAAFGAVSLKVRGSYTAMFRQRLARREVDLSEVRRYVTDPASLRLLVSMLKSPHERQILYSLGLLQSSRGYDFSAQLLPLLQHPSALVREEALRTLHALPGIHETAAARLLEDASDRVVDAAVEYICLHSPTQVSERLQRLIEHPYPKIRLAAARCAAEQPVQVFRPTAELVRDFISVQGLDGDRACRVAALLAAKLPRTESIPLLRPLVRDPRQQVAAGAVFAAGRARLMELVPDIMPLLTRRELRRVSRQALAAMGPGIYDTLGAILADTKEDLAVRREIPWILSQAADTRAAAILARNLSAEDFGLRYEVVKAVSRIHARDPRLPWNMALLTVHLRAQIMCYYEGLATLAACSGRNAPAGDLITRALRERQDRQLEIIFRLLGLRYSQKDIYFAYSRLKEQDRASAVEFLDNILERDLKPMLLPLLDDEAPEKLLARGKRFFKGPVVKRNDALLALLRQPDPWLKVCSLHAVGSGRISELAFRCRELLNDADSRVREASRWALDRMPFDAEESAAYADQS